MNKNNKIGDLSNAELTVTEIITADHITTANWSRPNPYPRPSNGLILLTEGSIKYYFENETVTANAGDLLLFPKGLNYSGVKLKDEINSFFVVDFFTACDREVYDFPLPLVLKLNHYDEIKRRFSELVELYKNGGITRKLQCKSKLYELFSNIIYDCVGDDLCGGDIQKFGEITEYIRSNYADMSLAVPSVCKNFYVSESSLRRMFSKNCGMSPVKYINNIRINAAKNMLTYDNIPISDVALKCGFSSLYYFSRLFKRSTGLSPSEYRKR